MGNLFYDEPRIEGKFKAGNRLRVVAGRDKGALVEFVCYTGADRNRLAYLKVRTPGYTNPECEVSMGSVVRHFFAESDLELIAVQETQHDQPTAGPLPRCTPLNPTGNPRYSRVRLIG